MDAYNECKELTSLLIYRICEYSGFAIILNRNQQLIITNLNINSNCSFDLHNMISVIRLNDRQYIYISGKY
jgi:hypothetical protein